MSRRAVPIGLADTHALVGRLHVPPDVDAGTAGRGAELIDQVLADLLERVLAMADEEPSELLVRGQTADEIVGHGGDGVIAAEALIQRLGLVVMIMSEQR